MNQFGLNVKPAKLERFADTYGPLLLESVRNNQAAYGIGPVLDSSESPETRARRAQVAVLEAMRHGGIYAVVASSTIKAAFKSLGVKPTYKAMQEWLEAD